MGLVALTENLILLQFEFCIDYDAEDGGKVLLKCNDVETVVQLSKGDIDKGSSGRSDAIKAGNIGIGQ